MTVLREDIMISNNYEEVKRYGDRREVLRARIASHDRSAARAMEELERLESFPDEPTNDPAILFFQKRFDRNYTSKGRSTIKKYDYVAVKAGDGLWYLSGPTQRRGYVWDELVEFMSTGVEEVWVVTDLERLF